MSPEDDFASIVDELGAAGVVAGRMFGAKALYLNGRAIGCLLRSGNAAFKLGRASEAHTAALTLPGADVFHPGGGSKAFKDWVEVPAGQSAHWAELAESALNAALTTGIADS
jgi:hypothetical protein